MKRKIYKELIEWKQSKIRKPLLLLGARQVGKTYILKQFGRDEYEDMLYFNFEEDTRLCDFFDEKIDPKNIINNLSIYSGRQILPDKHLIFFDEIQLCNNALNSLKYFNEQSNDYHVVSAGSMLGVKRSGNKSFPVGKVDILRLYPMNFLEFLQANGDKKLAELMENKTKIEPLPEPIHKKSIELLKYYYLTGGMPEVVKYFVETNETNQIRKIQNDILQGYEYDFTKYASSNDAPKMSLIWKSIPHQLSKDNNKFIFSAVKKSARSRDYENAVNWLEDNGLILISKRITKPFIPLKSYVKHNAFKVFLLDVGLLGALANIDPKIILFGDEIFTEFKGAFTENYVAQEFRAYDLELFYWESKGKAEMDFIVEKDNKVMPIEVKASINTKSKSMSVYKNKYKPDMAVKINLLNAELKNKNANIPLYAISLLMKL